jgi:hypothetical protein
MISTSLHEFDSGVLQPSPLKGNFVLRLQAYRGPPKEVQTPHCRGEKLWILGTEELLGLPCSLFLGMTAPLNLVEANRLSPRDSVLLTQNLH